MIMGIVFDITWMHSFNEIEGWSAHAQDNLNFIMSMLYAAHIVAVWDSRMSELLKKNANLDEVFRM